MNLFILRHAIAVERGTAGYAHDSERPLTAEGERKMYRIARGMQALSLRFDGILSSPYERAARTAAIVAEVFKAKQKVILVESLAVGGEGKALVHDIHSHCPGAESILLVGHEPYLSGLVSLLVSGEEHASITMKKAGLCKLNVDTLVHGQCATLEWLLTPRVMVNLR